MYCCQARYSPPLALSTSPAGPSVPQSTVQQKQLISGTKRPTSAFLTAVPCPAGERNDVWLLGLVIQTHTHAHKDLISRSSHSAVIKQLSQHTPSFSVPRLTSFSLTNKNTKTVMFDPTKDDSDHRYCCRMMLLYRMLDRKE